MDISSYLLLIVFFFNHVNNNLPRVYPTTCKLDILISYGLERVEMLGDTPNMIVPLKGGAYSSILITMN